MDAGKAAGLLVLLGVVGVLAAIVGSGVEAGPVKFPSIPGSRQLALAIASVCVIAGGAGWWLVQRNQAGPSAPALRSAAPGTLRVVLVPASGNTRVGDTLSVASTVYDSDGGLGPAQCVLSWRDKVDAKVVRFDTTKCDATFREPSVSQAGVHRITATAEGTANVTGTGSRSIEIDVGS